MSQTSIIAGSLIVAFVVFITVRGELPCYLEVMGISSGGGCTVSSGSTGILGTVVNLLGSLGGAAAGGAAGAVVGGAAQASAGGGN